MSICFGAFMLNVEARQLFRDGELVHLAPKAFEFLTILLNSGSKALSKAELHTALWPDTFVSEGNLSRVVADLRAAIRDTDNDQLLTVGKAYSGLTDVEIATLTQHFLDHTIEDYGRYRTVVPDTVLEIAFDTIQPSNRHQSGFALRFPRILRIRTDKTPAQIDTLETCRRLSEAANNFAAPAATAQSQS